jgi:virulence-associated protein VapD
MKTKKVSKKIMNTKVEVLLGEVESIISCVEDVIELVTANDMNTKVLESEEFENIRFIAEELQSKVVECAENEVNFTRDTDCVNESIRLYQQCKYSIDDLEESISDSEILKQFDYIKKAVNNIRNLFYR